MVLLMNEKKNLDDYYGEKIYAITDESICVFSTNKLVHHLANGHFHELKIYPNDSFFCFTTLNLYFFILSSFYYSHFHSFFGCIDIKKLIFLLYIQQVICVSNKTLFFLLRILSHKFIKFHIH